MRQVISATFVSLDGVMQAPGGPDEDPTGGFAHGGWTVPYWDDETGQSIDEAMNQPFDLLLGRKTYDIFAAHWPYSQEQPIADKFNAATKYVATSSTRPLVWGKAVALHDPAADVARLKKEDGPDLLIQGSGQLVQTLLAHHLIDRMTLLVFPLLLGPGKRFFGSGTMPAALKLTGSKVSKNGVTINTYVRGGKIQTGSFVPENPSDREIARREKMKREG
ncbi:MAG: dihydrofolate reductase family protein [Polaromonas sp.]|jgi:dihydrofolate reductase|nr:dihydrofolate reductase family protein [Polaromonas sp.]